MDENESVNKIIVGEKALPELAELSKKYIKILFF